MLITIANQIKTAVEHYRPHGIPEIVTRNRDKIYREYLGMFRGNPVYAVNGLFIRGDGTQTENIDIDFIEGGNYACYPYIPSPELWVDEVLSYKDRVYTILHEFLECRKMVYENWNYDTGKHRAHHYADHIEALMRVDPTIKFSTDFISDLETLYQRAKDRGLLH